jgi:hypothetical protein
MFVLKKDILKTERISPADLETTVSSPQQGTYSVPVESFVYFYKRESQCKTYNYLVVLHVERKAPLNNLIFIEPLVSLNSDALILFNLNKLIAQALDHLGTRKIESLFVKTDYFRSFLVDNLKNVQNIYVISNEKIAVANVMLNDMVPGPYAIIELCWIQKNYNDGNLLRKRPQEAAQEVDENNNYIAGVTAGSTTSKRARISVDNSSETDPIVSRDFGMVVDLRGDKEFPSSSSESSLRQRKLMDDFRDEFNQTLQFRLQSNEQTIQTNKLAADIAYKFKIMFFLFIIMMFFVLISSYYK